MNCNYILHQEPTKRRYMTKAKPYMFFNLVVAVNLSPVSHLDGFGLCSKLLNL